MVTGSRADGFDYLSYAPDRNFFFVASNLFAQPNPGGDWFISKELATGTGDTIGPGGGGKDARGLRCRARPQESGGRCKRSPNAARESHETVLNGTSYTARTTEGLSRTVVVPPKAAKKSAIGFFPLVNCLSLSDGL